MTAGSIRRPRGAAPGKRGRLRVDPMTAPPRPGGRVPPGRPPLPEIVVAGAHGGAGTLTLAALLRPAWDLGAVPVPGGRGGPLRPGSPPVVLVARSTVAAAGRAVDATTALTGPGARIAVLVVVSDGLPEPAEARYRFRLLEGRIGALVRMPFVPAFRVAASPLHVDLPRKAARALAEIRALAPEQMPAPHHLTRP